MEKTHGLSLDFIIHPGETIREVLKDRNMSQEELAIRTGFSAKHISEVVNGKKGISPAFAKSLEYVFGMPMSFWINLQSLYDEQILEVKEQEEIDEREVKIVKKLNNLIDYATENEIMDKSNDNISRIIKLRNLCNVNNLTYISELVTNQVSFRKSKTIDIDSYVLYVWLRICELMGKKENISNKYDEQKLYNSLDEIKKCMFLDINEAIEKLKNIFAQCGVAFQIVKNFPGAPVQGLIEKYENKIILSMTIRRSFADEFWFTLFHEIGHLLNDDVEKNNYVDYEKSDSSNELKADKFAGNSLINDEDFKEFIENENITEQDVVNFAKKEKVQPFIVVGRLQKEKNNYTLFYKLKVRYKWE